MTENITATAMLNAFKQDAPGHINGTRWAHTHGIGVLGHFKASDVARDFCRAEQFSGVPLPVTARFSNGSSDPARHDERPDTRGLAVKLHYPDGSDHDILAMSLSVFGSKTREQFLEISKAFVPMRIRTRPWFQRNILDPLMLRVEPPSPPPGVTISGAPGLAKYAGSHEFVRSFVIEGSMSMVPVSWARIEYHAVHTFMAVGPDEVRRPVRFVWQPLDGVFPVPPDKLAGKNATFLTDEMRRRLAHAPAQFTLRMSLGDPGDNFADPTTNWPVTRRSINMGKLVIEKMAEDEGVNVEHLSFNPMRLPPGIEPSEDVILHARGQIYQLGCEERNGLGCPLMHARGAGK